VKLRHLDPNDQGRMAVEDIFEDENGRHLAGS
jgi:hypothetical protein